jgi:hypothetical protein
MVAVRSAASCDRLWFSIILTVHAWALHRPVRPVVNWILGFWHPPVTVRSSEVLQAGKSVF